jgi:hypothetical protein
MRETHLEAGREAVSTHKKAGAKIAPAEILKQKRRSGQRADHEILEIRDALRVVALDRDGA